jgi:hypothetical protein
MDVTCPCGTTFKAKSPRAKYCPGKPCAERYRKRRQRGGGADVVVELTQVVGDTPALGSVAAATERELTEAGRLETALGQACMAMANRLDRPGVDTGSALAAVASRLESLLASATKGAGKPTSPQQLRDELAERRAKHG